MQHDEADRLDQGLARSFADFIGRIDDAWLEVRSGHRVVVCPRIPFGFRQVETYLILGRPSGATG